MRTQTKYIDTFVAAIEAGSFVRAAEQLHVTPSTVSYQIRQLEEWVGAPLFERSGRRVLPTALGDRLYGICGSFIDAMGSLRAAARGQAGTPREVLRIATGSSFGRYVLTPILAQPAFAQTVVDLRFGSDEETWEAVASGRADIGFAYTVTASNTLSFALAYRYPLVLIGAGVAAGIGDGPNGTPHGATFAHWLAASDFITYDDCEVTFTRWFETQLGTMPSALRTRGRCSEIEEAIALVAAGRGLSIVPRYMLDDALALGRVAIVAEPTLAVESHAQGIGKQAKPPPLDTVYGVTREGALRDSATVMLLDAVAQAQESSEVGRP
ncbi:LysR family transcriptional regulator [Robbsia sp. KACC 23696]|uniref:LysR family transcriptional regulator n=1 Tax=Robbsia sp. KACC 23696 TaxID=3149231 RepID=UPI00325B518E